MKTTRYSANYATKILAGVFVVLINISPMAWARPSLCDDPWTYRIGRVDARFGITSKDVHEIVNSAVKIWGDVYSCNFFKEDPNGAIVINFIYDARQQNLDDYRSLKQKVKRDESSRDTIEALLKDQKDIYEKDKAELASAQKAYEAHQMMLDIKTQLAKMQTKPNEKDRKDLANENQVVQNAMQDIKAREVKLQKDQDTIKGLESVLVNMKNDTRMLHNVTKTIDSPHQIGNFSRWRSNRSINIFICPNKKLLIRMVAHEFGHALGLGHSDNSEALMFWFLNSDKTELSSDDKEALRQLFHGFD